MRTALCHRLCTVSAALLLAACVGTPVELRMPAPGPQVQGTSREVKGNACGFQLFLVFPLGTNSRVERSYAEMVEEAEGDPIYDISVEEGWFYGYVGTGYCTEFRGTAVHAASPASAQPVVAPMPALAAPLTDVTRPRAADAPVASSAAPAPAPIAMVSASSPTAGLRSEGEIQAVMGHQKAASDRAVATATGGDATSGTLVVAFTVQPDGSVVQPPLVSSTLASPQAQVAVLGQLAKVLFRAKHVPAQRVTNYPIRVN